MHRPRLFYVLDSLEENEVGDQVATLLERLPRSRFEPRVVSLGPAGSLGSRIRELKVVVHRLELTGALGALLAVPRLRHLVSGLKGEVLHAFQPWSGAVAQLAAPRRVKVYRWVRGFPGRPRTLEERFKGWLERRAASSSGLRVVSSDEGARQAVMDRFRLDHVPVIPECVDLSRVRERVLGVRSKEARVRLGMAEGERAVLAFSDFREGTRMAHLLDGFATARVEMPGLRLFIHGGGPEEGALRWRAEDLHLEDSVLFLGASPQRETALRCAELVVDAGTWPGWCRGAVEAMALGLPTLRWLDEEAGDEAARYSFTTGAPPARFARDVLDLMASEGDRTRVATRCAMDAEVYDVATVADRWAEMYEG